MTKRKRKKYIRIMVNLMIMFAAIFECWCGIILDCDDMDQKRYSWQLKALTKKKTMKKRI